MKFPAALLLTLALPTVAACALGSHGATPGSDFTPTLTVVATSDPAAAGPLPSGPAPPALTPTRATRPAEAPASTPLVEPGLAALGDTRTRPSDGMVMVYVPGGQFQMGTDDDQMRSTLQLCGVTASRMFGPGSKCFASEFADETPAHRVELDGFWIDRFEVTNLQYQRCVESGACMPPVDTSSHTRNAYYGETAFENYPVVWVGWDQATDYCTWAGARLPTEAEWEYAARGPESLIFPWGDVFDGTRLNYCDLNCGLGPNDGTVDDGNGDTAPVGSYPSGASWCGALDMAGNVREWVTDWFGPYYGRQVNPSGPRSGEMIVSRGGSWLDPPENVRSAKRGRNTTDFAIYKLGIRCAH